MFESFENEDAYTWVCVGLFKPSLQGEQLFVPTSGSGPLIRASKKVPSVFNGSLAERAPGVRELSSLFELVGCAAVAGTVFNKPAIQSSRYGLFGPTERLPVNKLVGLWVHPGLLCPV